MYIKLIEILEELKKERARIKSEAAVFERRLNNPKDLVAIITELNSCELDDVEADISSVQKRVDRIYPLLKKMGYFGW